MASGSGLATHDHGHHVGDGDSFPAVRVHSLHHGQCELLEKVGSAAGLLKQPIDSLVVDADNALERSSYQGAGSV